MDATTDCSGFTRLPGWTAAQLILRGIQLSLVTLLLLPVVAFEAYLPGRWWYWGAPAVGIAIVMLSIGLTMSSHGYAKRRQEFARGYTTGPQDANDHPELYFLTRDDLQLISAPFAPRPPDGRRKTVRAFAGLPDQPLYRTRRGRPLEPVNSSASALPG